MGTKLKYLYLLTLLIISISCKIHKIEESSSKKEDYVLAYKKAVLYGCINAKTNKDFSKILIEHNDMILTKEFPILFYEIVTEATKLGEKYSSKINTHTYYEDLRGKIPIFSDCVSFAFGKEVDSIAKINYKRTR